MAFVNPKQYRDFYTELYNSDNIHSSLNDHYMKNRKTLGIPYSKFIMKFIKYLIWNIKETSMLTKFPEHKIKSILDISGFEIKKGDSSKTLNDPFKFRPINKKSLTILGIITTYYNTDAPEIIPETGKLLFLVEEMIQYYNKNTTGFGLVLGINCKHLPFVFDRNGKRVYLKNY